MDGGTLKTRTVVSAFGGVIEEELPEAGDTYARVRTVQASEAARYVTTYGSSGVVITHEWEYTHRDHLGSIVGGTGANGTSLREQAFDPFGAGKEPSGASDLLPANLASLHADPMDRGRRGFTDHEGLSRTGFVHMNGRVYDPRIGRFVSPDPIVQAPLNSQSWNRYAYVFNDPGSLADPNGLAACDLGGVTCEEVISTGVRQGSTSLSSLPGGFAPGPAVGNVPDVPNIGASEAVIEEVVVAGQRESESRLLDELLDAGFQQIGEPVVIPHIGSVTVGFFGRDSDRVAGTRFVREKETVQKWIDLMHVQNGAALEIAEAFRMNQIFVGAEGHALSGRVVVEGEDGRFDFRPRFTHGEDILRGAYADNLGFQGSVRRISGPALGGTVIAVTLTVTAPSVGGRDVARTLRAHATNDGRGPFWAVRVQGTSGTVVVSPSVPE